MISVPDAVHPPWQKGEPTQPPPLQPPPPAPPLPPCPAPAPFVACKSAEDAGESMVGGSDAPRAKSLPDLPLLRPLDEFDLGPLLAIQQALITFCQAGRHGHSFDTSPPFRKTPVHRVAGRLAPAVGAAVAGAIPQRCQRSRRPELRCRLPSVASGVRRHCNRAAARNAGVMGRSAA